MTSVWIENENGYMHIWNYIILLLDYLFLCIFRFLVCLWIFFGKILFNICMCCHKNYLNEYPDLCHFIVQVVLCLLACKMEAASWIQILVDAVLASHFALMVWGKARIYLFSSHLQVKQDGGGLSVMGIILRNGIVMLPHQHGAI